MNKHCSNKMTSLETADFLVGLTKKLLPNTELDYGWMEKFLGWADENGVSMLQKKLFFSDEKNNLDIISQDEEYLSNLAELNLTEYRLTDIPIEIGKLTNLTSLGLGGNHLQELPEEIGQLVNLEKLFLWGNQLAELPEEIVALANLKQLYLNDNPYLVLSQAQKDWIDKLEINNCDVKINEDMPKRPEIPTIDIDEEEDE